MDRFLHPHAHLEIKVVCIFVSSEGKTRGAGEAVKIGSLEPMYVPNIEIHIGAERPLCA